MKTKVIILFLICFIIFSCKKETLFNDSINNDLMDIENKPENMIEKVEESTDLYDYDDEGKIIYQKDAFGTEGWFENGMLSHKKTSNGDEQWFDNEGHRMYAKFRNGNEEWYDEEGEYIIHKKYTNGNEIWREYGTNGNLIHEYGLRFGHEYDLKGNLSVDHTYGNALFYYDNLVYSDDFHLEDVFYEYDSKNPPERRKNLITGDYSYYKENAVKIPDTGEKISGWCTFDDKKRITSLAVSGSGWGEAYWWFEYDDKNRIVNYSNNDDGELNVSLEYWSNGKIKRKHIAGVGGTSFYYGFFYDIDGNETFFLDSKHGNYQIKEYQNGKEIKSLEGGGIYAEKFLSSDGNSFYFDDEDYLIEDYLRSYPYESNDYQEKCGAVSIDENGRAHINEGYLLTYKTKDIETKDSEMNTYEMNYYSGARLFSKCLEEDDEGTNWGEGEWDEIDRLIFERDDFIRSTL